MPHRPVANGLLVCALLLMLGAHIATLVTLPHVLIDEPWPSTAPWTWLTTGVHVDSIHSGTLDSFGRDGIRRPLMGAVPWVLAFAIGGLGEFLSRNGKDIAVINSEWHSPIHIYQLDWGQKSGA